jgi:uncharacterized protein YcbK (DUF882 family)
MTEDKDFYYWQKGENPKLSANFYGSEFDCNCNNKDCVDMKISKALIENLQYIRNVVKSSIEISSGFRCSNKQQELRDNHVNTVVAKHSAHEDGLAADISCPSMVFAEFFRIAEPRFMNYGKARNWMHVDVRTPKSDGTKRVWFY